MTEQQAGLRFKFDGVDYDIFLSDLTGRDVKDFRAAVGMSPVHAFRIAPTEGLDIDVIAGFVWLAKRKKKPRTTYDEILDQISYGNVDVATVDEDEADEDDPEA